MSDVGTVSTESSKLRLSREAKYTEIVLRDKVARKSDFILSETLKSDTGLFGAYNTSSC